MGEKGTRSPDSDRQVGNDAPTQALGGADATLPLGLGMKPGNPQASSGPATHLGPYELIEMLGRGGMGTVWKARHTKLDKLVALKLLPPDLMSDADAVSRFEREMKAVGKLEHAHIVRAMDAGQAEGIHYLVMEYIEGVDLARLVKHRGPRKLAEACQMIRHAALGLAHAHEHGLVHRDIKPSNLLLSKRGMVKILDLGLARLQSEKGVGEASLTVNGEVMGTPDYMAPEQWQSAHTVGPAADLYALGCTLHFLLTGRAPFAGEQSSTFGQKMTAHVLKAAPALPDVPPELEALYQRLMAKEPEGRPGSAKELADELRAMMRSWTQSPAPAETIPWVPVANSTEGRKQRRSLVSARRDWLLAGAGIVLAGVVAWVAMGSRPWSGTNKGSHTDHENEEKVSATSVQPQLAKAPFLADQAREFQAVWSGYLGVPVEYTNSVGMQFRLIPPGEYERGTRNERVEPLLEYLRKWEEEKTIAPIWRAINKEGIQSEAPQHRVRIAQPFYLATCEVTQARFEQVMKYNRAYFGPSGAGRDQVDNRARPDLPVESVTFGEALEFCQKLGERDGLSGSSTLGAYRLPTDAEWEYACRAGTTTPFWFGFPADVKLMARCDETTPVRIARLKANPFGLYDMHGNVWELCEDYFSADDFARFEGGVAESPTGPAGGRAHVARGGSYSVGSMMCRSASRIPVSRPVQFVGFRPALGVEAVRVKTSATGTTMSPASAAPDVGSPEAKELFKLGRALCFVEDGWQKGMPLLAKGHHAGIRAAAQRELATPVNAEQQAELGKLWYEAAATAEDPDNWHCYRRARFWLTNALAAGSSESNSAWYQAAQKQMDILPTLKTALRIKARTFNHEAITIERNHIEWVSRDGAGPQQITNSKTGAELPAFHCKYGIRDVHTFDAEKVRTILPEAVDFTTARLRLISKSGPTSAWIRAFIDTKRSDVSKVTVVVAEWDQKKNEIGNYKGDFTFEVVLNFGRTD